jgi:hypothetical protein
MRLACDVWIHNIFFPLACMDAPVGPPTTPLPKKMKGVANPTQSIVMTIMESEGDPWYMIGSLRYVHEQFLEEHPVRRVNEAGWEKHAAQAERIANAATELFEALEATTKENA